MRIVGILNQKGGVGKTTTAVNLGAALAIKGRRVLLLDLDPQCNLTDHLGVEVEDETPTMYDVLTSGIPAPDDDEPAPVTALAEAILTTETEGLDVAPAEEDLAAIEVELAGWPGRERLLDKALKALPQDRYDWVIIDCPPSLGLLAINAMAACSEVFITLQTEYFALRGLGQLTRTVELVRGGINPDLVVAGILPTLVSPVTNLAKEVIEEVKEHFGDKVFKTRIRQNIRLAEAPGHQQHIFAYAPQSAGAADYRELAAEVDPPPRLPEEVVGALPAPTAKPELPAEAGGTPTPKPPLVTPPPVSSSGTPLVPPAPKQPTQPKGPSAS